MSVTHANGGGAARLAEALTRLGERKLTWPMLCARAGVDHSVADPMWRALGFPDVPPDQLAYSDEDVRALRLATEGLDSLQGEDRERALEFLVREARTVSGFLARVAETQVDALAELEALQLREGARAEALECGLERSPLGWLIVYCLRRRLGEAIRRRGGSEIGTEPVLVVGFIDLVEFTRASTGLDAAEFGRVLGRFEALAWDEVTESGGRLVKLVGDEAMFVCPPTVGGAEAALVILGHSGHDGLPDARAGLAAGPVLIRGGDYFGPVVNLASRLVDSAPSGAVVVDDTYRGILEADHPDLNVEPLEERQLKGIGAISRWRLKRGDDGTLAGRD